MPRPVIGKNRFPKHQNLPYPPGAVNGPGYLQAEGKGEADLRLKTQEDSNYRPTWWVPA